eukprot:scaffold71507_cov35-Attheya_sp.AAC.4
MAVKKGKSSCVSETKKFNRHHASSLVMRHMMMMMMIIIILAPNNKTNDVCSLESMSVHHFSTRTRTS